MSLPITEVIAVNSAVYFDNIRCTLIRKVYTKNPIKACFSALVEKNSYWKTNPL